VKYPGLVVTSQPTAQVCLFLFVTLDAKFHFKTDSFEPVHSFHIPVAFIAGEFFLDMPLVVEKYVLRNVVDLDPWGRRLGIEIVVLLLNLGMFGDNVLMAVQTFLHWRNPRECRTTHVRVTELTLNLFHSGMNPMAERYGLCRTDVGCRWNIEIVEKSQHKKDAAADKEQRSLIHL
jgi:hypothetical protein